MLASEISEIRENQEPRLAKTYLKEGNDQEQEKSQ